MGKGKGRRQQAGGSGQEAARQVAAGRWQRAGSSRQIPAGRKQLGTRD